MRIAMLVVLRSGVLLLEKRAATGIWGGLWSLPEAPADEPVSTALQRDWGLAAAETQALPPFEHAFTHFTLEVSPWRIGLARGAKLAESKPAMWMPLADVNGAALPSPVKRLLAALVTPA
jgi:A/G-specific adenine glycosylase